MSRYNGLGCQMSLASLSLGVAVFTATVFADAVSFDRPTDAGVRAAISSATGGTYGRSLAEFPRRAGEADDIIYAGNWSGVVTTMR